jgi:hypothetical protein
MASIFDDAIPKWMEETPLSEGMAVRQCQEFFRMFRVIAVAFRDMEEKVDDLLARIDELESRLDKPSLARRLKSIAKGEA